LVKAFKSLTAFACASLAALRASSTSLARAALAAFFSLSAFSFATSASFFAFSASQRAA